MVLDLPLVRTEPADEEQDEADADVRQHDAQPDVQVQRVHEREDRPPPLTSPVWTVLEADAKQCGVAAGEHIGCGGVKYP